MEKLKLTLGIGLSGATREEIIEIPAEELEGLTEDERNEVLDDYWRDWSNNYIDGGVEIL